MANPALLAKAAVIVLTDEKARKAVGWVLVAVLSPIILLMRWNYSEAAMGCMELASALALYAYGRELRQLGEPRSGEELVEELRGRILPYQNRSSLKKRITELVEQTQLVLERTSVPGLRSEINQPERDIS